MAHSNSQETHAGRTAPRKQIDLFDPHQAMRRSPASHPPVPTAMPSTGLHGGTPFATSTHVQPFHPPLPRSSAVTTTSPTPQARGISPFAPTINQAQRNPGRATQLQSPIPTQPVNPSSNHPSPVFLSSGYTSLDHQQPGHQQPGQQSSDHASSGQQRSADHHAENGMRSLFGGGRRKTDTAAMRGSGRQKMAKQGLRSPDFRYLLAGGSLLAGVVLVGDVGTLLQPEAVSDVCQEIVQPDATLSRDDLTKLIAIPERDSKAAVREVVSEPYCVLPGIEVRAGEHAEREAYPLEFDPQTWVVLLYEGDEYAGYAFSFKP